MPVTYNKPSRYDYVSRKVFDKQVDRWTGKIAALREEVRILEQKLFRLESSQTSLLDFLSEHEVEEEPPARGALPKKYAEKRYEELE